MTLERFNSKDDLGKAGILLALVGGLLALVPALERLLALPQAWPDPFLEAVGAGAVLTGAWLMTRDEAVTGALIASVAGIVLVVLGPSAPGVLALIGGVLVYASAQEPGPALFEPETGSTRLGP